MNFHVDQIDHVEFTVPDRFEAADWYRRVLGLEIVPEYQFWADDPLGPLMISTPHGATKLALFVGKPTGSRRAVGFHRVAFRVDGARFLEFLATLESLELKDSNGQSVTREDTSDHQLAFSLYFCDPWRHELELTTYDHETVRQAIKPR